MAKNDSGSPLRSLVRWKSVPTLRAARNAAREHDWPLAAGRYRGYLRQVPDDARAWVQYGHVLKEAGQLAEAEDAYGQAMRLGHADADLPLHLAHLLKRMGPERDREATSMMTAIARSKPATSGMLRELLATGNGVDVASLVAGRPAGLPTGAICIELQDLFQYLSLHTTVTGITRVTLSIVNYVLHEMQPAAAARYHFVHQYGDGEGVMLVTKDYMLRIVRAAMHEQPNLPAMQALIGEIRDRSQVFRLTAGDTYLIVGAFWEFVANPSWLAGMRHRGVNVGSYIYDLIPITYAQYCMQGLTDAFTLAFSETARLLDFAMTISAFVADEVTGYLDAHGIPRFPVEPVLLAHELRFADRAVPAEGGQAPATAREYLSGIPFVLCVCTIEARKNHSYLVTIWQRMIDAGINVPDLVFVGRPGWRVEQLMADIVDGDYLGGRLHILNGLADDELESLYDRCLFTVFPSFVEGWGLPVGESLAYGKLCVASSTSSVPEVGGEHAIYVDPFDIEDGYAVISDLILDPGKLAGQEASLRRSFRARTWNDVGRDFFETTERLVAGLGDPADRRLFAPVLPSTRLFETKKASKAALRGGPYISNPERLAFVSGWRQIEATGTWMLDQEAWLRVRTDCAPTKEVTVLVHLGTSDWVDTFNVLSISVPQSGQDEPAYQRPMFKGQDFWIRLTGQVDAQGMLTLHFRIAGPIRTPEGVYAPVALRLHGIGYAPTEMPEARIALLERALLSR